MQRIIIHTKVDNSYKGRYVIQREIRYDREDNVLAYFPKFWY